MQQIVSFFLKKAIGFYINTISYIFPSKAARLAYRFFSEPRDGRLLKERLPEILKQADAEIITYNDFIFQMYTWQGNQQKVLLVHGWESNASRWEQLLLHLKKSGSTIIAVDAPAHGLSSGKEFNIPTYARFIDIIVRRLEPQYLIGHSLGGATALYYQSHYKNTAIEKMVTIGAPCDLSTLLSNYKAMLSLNNRVFRLLEKHFLSNFKIDPADFSGRYFASKIKVEGLVAHDTEDEVVPFKEGQKIAGAWSNAEFVVTTGLGHSMHDEALNRKIYNFLFAR